MSHSFPSSRGSSTCLWYMIVRKMSDKNLEQWINIKFCVKIGKSASETLALLTVAYGEYAMKKLSVFEWLRRFTEGQEDVEDDPRSGQPKTKQTDANVERIQTLVCPDRRLGVRVMAELNMNRETVRQIVKEDLGMKKISTKMVPRILTHDQKQRRLHIYLIFYAMQRCLIGSLLVMKHGVFNMNWKQNDGACSGKHRIHLGWKKHARLGHRSRPCLCVSSITRGKFTMNSFHKDKW